MNDKRLTLPSLPMKPAAEMATAVESYVSEAAVEHGLRLLVFWAQGRRRRTPHWRVTTAAGKAIVDWWPATGTYISRDGTQKGVVKWPWSLLDLAEALLGQQAPAADRCPRCGSAPGPRPRRPA